MLLQKNNDFQYYIYHIDAYYGKDIKVKYDVNISCILSLLIRIESIKKGLIFRPILLLLRIMFLSTELKNNLTNNRSIFHNIVL